ncbi:MAG TPA: ChbG/HpnK family deacetylase [Candidatus Dormibacteraeota bacterium]|nr:ChbG/HpnK family deacetylase [Candidatus Dormibacteraeota bacterium]
MMNESAAHLSLAEVPVTADPATGQSRVNPPQIQPAVVTSKVARGCLVVNADDWGRDTVTTDRILDCIKVASVSSASAMVFMEDSERAATLACERKIDAGLHLNFTTQFSASNCPAQLREHQHQLGRYLLRHRFAQTVFHPGLMQSFEYVVAHQIDEFRRIYGTEPARLDGHHHMHLCANVLWQGLLPAGAIVRRGLFFNRTEKGLLNRLYRKLINRRLARRHRLLDFLFNLSPLEPASRLQRIYSLARDFAVELEVHPVNPDEYQYLTGGEIFCHIKDFPITASAALLRNNEQ